MVNLSDGLYQCDQCGVIFCLCCSEGAQIDAGFHQDLNMCSVECWERYREDNPPEKIYPAPGQGTVAAITGTRF